MDLVRIREKTHARAVACVHADDPSFRALVEQAVIRLLDVIRVSGDGKNDELFAVSGDDSTLGCGFFEVARVVLVNAISARWREKNQKKSSQCECGVGFLPHARLPGTQKAVALIERFQKRKYV